MADHVPSKIVVHDILFALKRLLGPPRKLDGPSIIHTSR